MASLHGNVPTAREDAEASTVRRAPNETDGEMPPLLEDVSSDDSDAEDAQAVVVSLRASASPSPAPTVVQDAESDGVHGITVEDDHGQQHVQAAMGCKGARRPRQALLTNVAKGERSTWLKRQVSLGASPQRSFQCALAYQFAREDMTKQPACVQQSMAERARQDVVSAADEPGHAPHL